MTKTIEILAGANINQACSDAVKSAQSDRCNVSFEFNDQTIVATPQSIPEALVKQYHYEMERARAAYEASPEYAKRKEEYERKEHERNTLLESTLKDAPANMTLRDPAGWKAACEKNKDPYGNGVMTYSERWARLMEARMSKGEKLADIADECSHLADSEGITGFMYGCAVSTLAAVWVHGEELRQWHNLKTQIGKEGEKANASGGVLNPALLNIG